MGEIKNTTWVTVNNDFLVTSEMICLWFSRVAKSRVKIIGKSHHEWPKIVIYGNKYIIILLTRYTRYWTYNFAKNNHRSLISHLLRGTVFSDLALRRHHGWSVTSSERELLALWRHFRRLFLHAHICTKAIFISEYAPKVVSAIEIFPVFNSGAVTWN